jgi:ATP-dependent RNA helicase SUPV3L1/SUV3
MPALPPPSCVVLSAPAPLVRTALARLGFRSAGPQMIRVDMAERLARHAHEVRAGKDGRVVDEALVTSLGLQPQALARLMRDIGFRPGAGDSGWVWRGRAPRRPRREPGVSHAFAALGELTARPGSGP